LHDCFGKEAVVSLSSEYIMNEKEYLNSFKIEQCFFHEHGSGVISLIFTANLTEVKYPKEKFKKIRTIKEKYSV
jgi:hypothetical protein